MTTKASRIAFAAAIAANSILISCSSGPTPPQKGSPAFHWQAAREMWGSGDYAKTIENLDTVIRTENEFTTRARPWLLVAASGMANGYIDLAEHFEGGGRVNKSDPVVFRKQVSNARGAANRLALRFAEVFAEFEKAKEEDVLLAFAFPTGSPSRPAVMSKIGNGMLPTQADIDAAEKGAVQRGVVLATCRASGTPDDAAKVQAVFRAGEVKVPHAVFTLAMAHALHEHAQLFSRNKLDQPERLKIFCERAQAALKTLPESKETKDLNGKIQATLKKAKA
jgi:hypothetical protein